MNLRLIFLDSGQNYQKIGNLLSFTSFSEERMENNILINGQSSGENTINN